MMIKKQFLMLCMVSTITYATSSMSGIKKQGYFDDDNIIDLLHCEKNDTTNYTCLFKLGSGVTKVFKIVKNNDCSEFSINAGKEFGEVIIQCSHWGINNTYYYLFNSKESDWYLNKYIYEKLPMDGPDDIGEEIIYDCFSKKWSISDGLEKPKQNICHTFIMGILIQKQPLYKSPTIDSKTKMYLIKGDKVEILEEKDNWLHIFYKGKKEIKAWIPKDAVETAE